LACSSAAPASRQPVRGAGPLGRCPARQGAPANLKACFRRRTRRTRLQSGRKRPDCELEQLREHETVAWLDTHHCVLLS